MEQRRQAHLPPQNLDFLWLELTNQCNLHCMHCYADSGPWSTGGSALSTEQYYSIIGEAYYIGCRRIQFIGGEPTISPALCDFIACARQTGYSFIEVFSNLTRLNDTLLRCLEANCACIATSVYSHVPAHHDFITRKQGSFARTVYNIERLLGLGIKVRVGIIDTQESNDEVEETLHFVRSLGVHDVGVDRVRRIGRGKPLYSDRDETCLTELCGACWQGSVCIAADGQVSPCIMAKSWSAGSVCDEPFAALVTSPRLHAIRERIYSEVWLPIADNETADASCAPACRPNCVPSCNPKCSPNCRPCYPAGKCNPILF